MSEQPHVLATQPRSKPVVLFACIHNSGRSVVAKLLAEHFGGDRIDVRSAGSEPSDAVNPAVAIVLAERGLSTDRERPTLLHADLVRDADVVITMGCGESCPYVPGVRYEDWTVDDPAGQELDIVRLIVDNIEQRVRKLLADLSLTI
jgi:arsenate reductase